MAATIPNCKSCEPAFAAELAWIVDAGIREMMEEQHDVFYYVTLLNESYPQPAIAATHREGALRGAYLFEPNEMQDATQRVTLLGSGVILTEVVKAAASLRALGIGV
jgi:pyruvate dehydrogenase E1 component